MYDSTMQTSSFHSSAFCYAMSRGEEEAQKIMRTGGCYSAWRKGTGPKRRQEDKVSWYFLSLNPEWKDYASGPVGTYVSSIRFRFEMTFCWYKCIFNWAFAYFDDSRERKRERSFWVRNGLVIKFGICHKSCFMWLQIDCYRASEKTFKLSLGVWNCRAALGCVGPAAFVHPKDPS